MKGNISIRQEIKKYVPLLLLPILFSVMLYTFVHGFTVRQLESGAEQSLDLFYMQISAMVRETDNMARSLNSDFSALSNLSGTDTLPYSFDDPMSICTQIDIRINDSPYIDHVYFISPQEDSIYSDRGYYTYNSLPSILSGLGLRTEDFLRMDEASWNMSTAGILKEPYYVAPFRSSDGEIAGRLLFTISLDSFMEIFSSLDAEFACLYSEDFLISSRPLGRSYSIADLSSEKSVGDLLSTPVKCFYVSRGDYTYLIALSAREYYMPLIWMIVGFLIYVLLVFVIDYLYLLKVSKARYAELTALINALPQESGEGSPSYHELVPAVQEALLDAADLRKRQQQLSRDRVIHNLLHRYYKPSLLEKYAREAGVPSSGVTYYLALFSIRKTDSIALAASSPDDSRQMAWTIFKAAAAQFEDGIQIVCDNDTDAFNALFCGDFESSPTHVEAVCENICRFIHDEYGILLHASVSNPTTDFSDIPDLLSQAQRLESFSQSINSSSPVISEGLLKGRSGGGFISGNFFRQQMTLSSTLLAKKYDVIPSMAASILEEHVTRNPDYDLAMSRLKAVSGTLAEALLTVKGVDLDLNFYAQRLREVNTVSELNADVEFVFSELDSIAEAAPAAFKEVDEACAYVKKNLADKNLNVTMISEAVGTIPQRLIPMFQKQLNMGIAEYVNFQRIEQATKLLTTTKLKATQISDQVGYCNTDTFTRNFRKLMGVTPTEYRQMSM